MWEETADQDAQMQTNNMDEKEERRARVERPVSLSASSTASDHEIPIRRDKIEPEIDPDIDHDEIEAVVAGHELDVELAKTRNSPSSLRRIETRGSVKSKVSRAISILSRKKTPRERIPFAPIPTSNLDEGVVGWDGQDDPAMPLNFAQRKKWLIVGLLSAITLLTPFASSILAPGIGSLNKEFGNGNQIVGAMTVSIYLLGYVIGPLFLAPLSEIYGRRPVLSAANIFFCVWQIGCALAPSIESLLVFRFFSGIGGAGCLTLGAGVIADVFRTDERGFAIGIYTIGPLLGPTIGPLLGGFLSQTIGWRWDFWIVFIVAVIIVGLTEIFNSETNPRVLMHRKVARLRKELGRDDLRSCYDLAVTDVDHKSPTRILMNGLVRPTKMLFLSPLVFFLSLYMAFTYGVLYLLFTTIPIVFQETYHWNVGLTGLVYICMGLGNLAGWAVVTATSDKNVVKLTRANDGVFEPEMRLPISIYMSFALPVTFFIYGWTTHFQTHWIFPILGLFPFSFGIIGLYLPITTYLVDCYPVYAASAIAANTVLRSLAGMLLPLAGPSMYENLGLGWGNSMLGFVCIAMIPVPLLIHRFGARLRKAGLQL
ncbi:major facilitator superfamily domain-containing protein [Lasiosphaeria hispida]|uniref:Major facilitator superfamily domain-containing protein n=1 Tax=Lasiosphaeria hispida TaxID=260671 RepID=A0AAJ0HNP9_9PEZI|nr:major facilitator superfamily domain-containing protein [Lasiosphaeria hispida]